MNKNRSISFFSRRQKTLRVVASVYVVLLLLSHWRLPAEHVWAIAAFFSIAMNFTYLTEAISLHRSVRSEAVIASILIIASLLGLLGWPLLIIAAIFGHGCWDLAKHFGSGVRFFFWYTCSCFVVDSFYSFVLILYWLNLR